MEDLWFVQNLGMALEGDGGVVPTYKVGERDKEKLKKRCSEVQV
jgi:hypothetical protein